MASIISTGDLTRGFNTNFLYFWAHIRSAGAKKTTNTRTVERIHAIVRESDAVRVTADRINPEVKKDCMTADEA